MQRDAVLGRIYAPRELCARHGVTEPHILAGLPRPELRAMLKEFVELAKNYLVGGGQLIERVPRWLALDVRLFRAGGLAILSEITALKLRRVDAASRSQSLVQRQIVGQGIGQTFG